MLEILGEKVGEACRVLLFLGSPLGALWQLDVGSNQPLYCQFAFLSWIACPGHHEYNNSVSDSRLHTAMKLGCQKDPLAGIS